MSRKDRKTFLINTNKHVCINCHYVTFTNNQSVPGETNSLQSMYKIQRKDQTDIKRSIYGDVVVCMIQCTMLHPLSEYCHQYRQETQYNLVNFFVQFPFLKLLYSYVIVLFACTIKDDFYSKIPTKNFFYFLPICSLKYAQFK